TMVTTRLLAKRARSASLLLAMRRLADNPKGAFRPVSVLVIATFLCSIIAVFAPIVTDNSGVRPANQSNSFTHYFDSQHPIDSAYASTLIDKLQAIPGTRVIPTYTTDDAPADFSAESRLLVLCADIERGNIGIHCPAGATALKVPGLFGTGYREGGLNRGAVTTPPAEIRQRPLNSFAIWTSGDPALREQLRTMMAQYPV